VATVVSAKKVDYLGEKVGLSVATRLVMGTDYNLNPGPYWNFDGKTISEIYNDTYGTND
jgi:hypothetical protein